MNKPSVTEGINFVNYAFSELGLRVVAERYDDDGFAELTFFKNNDSGELVLYKGKANLLSTPTQNSLVKRLRENLPDAPWVDVITSVSLNTLEIARRGEPVVPVGKKPVTLKVEYQLAPILEKGQPTTIYGPGGSAKSYLADYITVQVQLNYSGIYDWLPTAGNVLYLDWEASKADHDRRVWAIKKGLGIDTEDTFLYRFCSQPLVSDIHSIQSLVFENQIDLIIVDSQMAATGYGPDQAQVASQFYNALRSLRCTTLTLDHVSKEDWKSSDSVGQYGSVVKYNRSRSQFEIKKSQNAGDDFIELSLIHRKHNEGKLLKPIGIRINFNENTEGQLESVTFESCNIEDNPELSRTLSTRDRIVGLLKHGKLEVKAISEELDITEATIRARLNDNKRLFKHFADGWGLLE